jgi:hypothetical protein
MRSSGLEALTCPFSTKFLRSTELRFTTSPAIGTYTLLGNRASFSSVILIIPFICFLEQGLGSSFAGFGCALALCE